MKEEQLKEALMEGARRGGICAEGYEKMRAYDREELVGYYTEHPEWGMRRGFPSLELLRREFGDIEDKGVYVGKIFHGETICGLPTYIFHNCKGTIKVAMDYDNPIIPMLYFANGCDMRVECEQKNDPAIVVPLYIAEGATGSGEHAAERDTGSGATRRRVTRLESASPTSGTGAAVANKVVGAKSENCVFKRHVIKPVEP